MRVEVWSAAAPAAALDGRSASCGWRKGERRLASPHSRRFAFLLLCAVPLAAQSSAVDVLHYTIELTLPRSGTEITAAAELTLLPRATPLEMLALDFGALTIDSVQVEGKAAEFTREGERLNVRVARASADPFRVRIAYHGSPADGLVLRPNKHGDFGAFADNWPNRAHQWFPSIDHPSDKASVEFVVTAPETFDVVANGTLVETVSLQDGGKRWHWRESTPIPVHCMVVGATQFAIVRAGEDDGVEVAYYLYPRDREHGMQFGRVVQILDFFGQTIGAYPYDKLAIVESSTRFGGMENASAIFLDEKRIEGKEDLERLVAHEIAHQWFGDSVSQRDWYDLWLSEGFATYFAALFAERTGGTPALRTAMADARALYLGAADASAHPIHDPSITELPKLLNRLNYQKGAWVLHMLRGVVGDAPFFAGIREYYATYRNGNASTAELRAIMERHAGQPLEWFFRQWIYEPGHPFFTTKWTWRGGKVLLDVAQTQQGTLFRMPATIELRDDAGTRRERVLIDARQEHFELDSPLRPEAVVLDPDQWILSEF
jgi:aminopeptidase N